MDKTERGSYQSQEILHFCHIFDAGKISPSMKIRKWYTEEEQGATLTIRVGNMTQFEKKYEKVGSIYLRRIMNIGRDRTKIGPPTKNVVF